MISKTIMILAIAAAVVAGTLTTATIVTAQVDTIQACVDTKKGNVRIVSSAADCDPSKETPIQWNAQGPTGPPGADGQDGAPGADGQDGAPGADGQDGADGLTPIFITNTGPDICPESLDGFSILFGFDLNGNGVLDKVVPGEPPEILASETICDGMDGAPGADGQDGAPGADGSSCSISGTVVSCTDGTSNDVEGPPGVPCVDCVDAQSIAANSVGGSEIVGIDRLIFDVCVSSPTEIPAGSTFNLVCNVPGAGQFDSAIGTINGLTAGDVVIHKIIVNAPDTLGIVLLNAGTTDAPSQVWNVSVIVFNIPP